jgi:hypothetical protein
MIEDEKHARATLDNHHAIELGVLIGWVQELKRRASVIRSYSVCGSPCSVSDSVVVRPGGRCVMTRSTKPALIGTPSSLAGCHEKVHS